MKTTWLGILAGFIGLSSAAEFPLIERRGRVLLLVDTTLSKTLTSDVALFRNDLIGDGWDVTLREGPRHQDVRNPQTISYPGYKADQLTIKGLIRDHYQQATNDDNVCILLGHLTVPYSGSDAEDGHKDISPYQDHCGAWPSDAFYGDMVGVDGTGKWLDVQTSSCGQNRYYDNSPDDGIWDHNSLPGDSPRRLDVAIGRIDFSALADFVGQPLANNAANEAAVEIALIRNYLLKARRFRQKTLTFSPGMMHSGTLKAGPAGSALVTAFFGANYAFERRSLFVPAMTNALLFGHHGGAGWVNFVAPDVYSATLANQSLTPNAAFVLVNGSLFGDFQSWNPFVTIPSVRGALLRSCLAATNAALTVSYNFGNNPEVTRFSQNRHYGTVIQDSFGSRAYGRTPSVRITYCLGDPTLHAFVARPPTGLAAGWSDAGVHLTWNLPPGGTAYVDRAVFGTNGTGWGSWERLSLNPVGTGSMDDTTAPLSVPKMYRVRAIETVTVGIQTGKVLSQGALITID